MKERMVEAKVVMQEERLNKREITYGKSTLSLAIEILRCPL